MTQYRKFCALCLRDIVGPPRMEPLGRNDALVACCSRCTGEPAVARTREARAYEPPNEKINILAAVREAHKRVVPERIQELEGAGQFQRLVRDPSPGFILIRVPILGRNGVTRDRTSARKTLRDKPWFKSVRYLGCTGPEFLFERPDPKAEVIDLSRELEAISKMGEP